MSKKYNIEIINAVALEHDKIYMIEVGEDATQEDMESVSEVLNDLNIGAVIVSKHLGITIKEPKDA
jgi:hypothetical protein